MSIKQPEKQVHVSIVIKVFMQKQELATTVEMKPKNKKRLRTDMHGCLAPPY